MQTVPTRLELDPAKARVAQRVDAERNQAGGDEPDRFVRVVFDRGFDQEDSDQGEDDQACEVAEAADPFDPRPNPVAHLLGLRVFEEVLADSAVTLVEADSDQENAGDSDKPRATRPPENARGFLRRVAGAAAARTRADQDLDRDRAQARVHAAAPESRDAVELAVRGLRPVPDRRVHEPPERVARETDCDENQQHLPKRLVREGLQGALLVRRLASGTKRELDREDADDSVDQAASDEPRTRQPFEAPALRDLVCAHLGAHGVRTARRCFRIRAFTFDTYPRRGRPRWQRSARQNWSRAHDP